ncbi:hypothetical protein Ade02nite_78450 [Paractinoplanes deccanensis]|uniref:Integral membrane protein n=1 Tax=Paractinoplanes deccanensis TaxID=113561 RepID=A0ABQ3YGW4_9ACTN|nr:hypothetical protein [Actinoplanes deccanensis]GID79204.1 hypothetical protein Ade02nite_78450 [Actinoplanes deccanensis]
MGGNWGVRAAARELVEVTAMWLGMGEPGTDPGTGPQAPPAPPRPGAAFMVVQTLAAVALGALLAGAWAIFFERDVRTLYLAGYLPLLVPLAIGVARRPAAAAVPLAAALPVGALTVVALRALPAAGDGFWWWFLAFAAGALTAGATFGAVTARRTTEPTAPS